MTTESVLVNQQSNSSESEALNVQQQQSFLPQMLRFQIIPATYSLLPLKKFVEVLKIPLGQIVSIPHLPSYVMGVYNWRGAVLWTIDLGCLLGMTPYGQYRKARSAHTTLVIERQDAVSGFQQLGLVIHDIVDTVEVDPTVITATELSSLSQTLAQFLSGCWVDEHGEILIVLDEQLIFDHVSNAQM